MNSAVKRKFNALLQGITSRPDGTPDRDRSSLAEYSSLDDMPSPPSFLSSSRGIITPDNATASELKKRRLGGAATATTATPMKSDTSILQPSPASIRSVTGSLTTTTTVSNITLRRWTSTPNASTTSIPGSLKEGMPPPPRYCPSDRDQLIRRLATFQELTEWTPKPDRVNEIEWAKRGWTCSGKEKVKCVLCGAELAVKVNRKEVDGKEVAVLIASEIEEAVIEKYASLIVDAHKADCLWRKKGCDGSLLRLPYPNNKLVLQDLRQRYDELCERSTFLPYEFSIRLPDGLDIDTVISYLPPNFFTEPPPKQPAASSDATKTNTSANTSKPSDPTSSTINRSALALALLGWQSLTHPTLHTPIPNSASCHTCLRRLGLWMFKPREIDPSTKEVIVPAPMSHLDPVREHRFFCPWRNPATQKNPGLQRKLDPSKGEREMPAWEVVLAGLRNEAFIRGKVDGNRARSGTLATVAGETLAEPRTPDRRPVASSGATPRIAGTNQEGEDESVLGEGDSTVTGSVVDEEEAKRKKDMDVMSRLRRVKSLFNAKGGKLKKGGSVSRPGTGNSG